MSKRPFNKRPRIKKRVPKRNTPSSFQNEPSEIEGMRLNKYIAHCGICSRRQAAELIKEGKVMVNDEVQLAPGYQVQLDDVIKFEGEVVQPEEQKVYVLLNKPKNYITTLKDEKGRKTVMDIIGGKVKERIFPVGRLDRATTGLLLLTNDGELAQKLAHPSNEIKKVYQVELDRPVTKTDLDQIAKGLELEDGSAPVDQVYYLRDKPKSEVGIEIHIGRNRIVRRIFESLDYQVVRLDRVYYAGLTKKNLSRGFFRHLNDQEVIMLKHFV